MAMPVLYGDQGRTDWAGDRVSAKGVNGRRLPTPSVQPPPVPAVPDRLPVRCTTCGQAIAADDTAKPDTIAIARRNHDRFCHGITRCTCGDWALRNHACGTCARMVREPYLVA